jgi:hypothetical protein
VAARIRLEYSPRCNPRAFFASKLEIVKSGNGNPRIPSSR